MDESAIYWNGRDLDGGESLWIKSRRLINEKVFKIPEPGFHPISNQFILDIGIF